MDASYKIQRGIHVHLIQFFMCPEFWVHITGVHPLLHSKIRNVPFPRPCEATGNDARKLHALAFVHVRSALLMHEVLCV